MSREPIYDPLNRREADAYPCEEPAWVLYLLVIVGSILFIIF